MSNMQEVLEAFQGQTNPRFDAIDAAIKAIETRTPAAPPTDPPNPEPAKDGALTWDTVLKALQDQKVVNPDGTPVTDYQFSQEVEMAARRRGGALTKAITGLDNIAGLGIPWGSALTGGLVAIAGSEIIDGFVPVRNDAGNMNFLNPVLKLVGAGVSAQVIGMFAGRTAGNIAAAIFVVEAIRVLLPLDEWVANLRDFVLRRNATAGQARERQAQPLAQQYAQGAAAFQQFPGSGGAGHDRLSDVFN